MEAAPKWIPDKDADTCMSCKTSKFTVVNRRHHCRNCGHVICGDCSKNKFLLASQSDEPLREDETANTDSSDESDTDENATGSNVNDENDVIKLFKILLENFSQKEFTSKLSIFNCFFLLKKKLK